LPRYSLRQLIQNDSITATLATAPAILVLEAGRFYVDFRTMEELAGSLMALAEILSDPHEFAEFERRYVPVHRPNGEHNEERHELEALFADLRDLELRHAEESVLWARRHVFMLTCILVCTLSPMLTRAAPLRLTLFRFGALSEKVCKALQIPSRPVPSKNYAHDTGGVMTSAEESRPRFWYEEPGVIKHKFYGVFAGGGAKGIAYCGALDAMAEMRCWFSAVAGASAGAITAALVASGLEPAEIESQTDAALACVRTTLWRGLRRLERDSGYFPSAQLRQWLHELLTKQVERKTGTKTNAPVTFKDLHSATGIELNIVAADLSLRRQIVFSHTLTQNCAVADAVVASSAIPFAFASGLLQVPHDGSQEFCHHTIVDGGVWSNFPMFIFEDAAYRSYYKLEPTNIEPHHILGLLLREESSMRAVTGKDVTFPEVNAAKHCRALEWEQKSSYSVDTRPTLASTLATCALLPFSLLGRWLESKGVAEPGRWPAPRSKPALHLVTIVNGLLSGLHPLGSALFACAIVAVGGFKAGSFLTVNLYHQMATEGQSLGNYARLVGVMMVAGIYIAVAILLIVASLLAVTANFLLLRASRRILYGLITTYVSGPGAPEWIVEKGNIVELPIPPEIGALSFEMSSQERTQLIKSARSVTKKRLEEIMSRNAGRTQGATP